ncbi:hypothetical protein COW82_03070 [Candidatus Campbellbacteria bacterium CG22_combo_CG10-13_8_21_14_all_43_18]|uniref:DUF5668 domain-containing protein n=1 Tax=Candidatus Campbellbacteria bacterium CG22_combo_CG10-13_8_21_14_all_43_18 TaxID=1974530 RepID=A0A2H0DW82_9BACT|nr:MAG: hypothetical protein COW82_03070 [Candidatus Campbellbacteria bacterium CG22_combo_CG10-13_8_21_14_all_43_18]
MGILLKVSLKIMIGGSHGKLAPLFLLLIAIIFLLGGLGVFDQAFVGVAWPILLGVLALIWMGEGK